MSKVLLAVLTILLMASMGGGFLLLPVLVPLHVWAARTSGPVGRALWSVGPMAAVALLLWALVYITLGEAKPAIWAVPTLGAIGMAMAMRHLSRPSTPSTVSAHA